MHSISRHFFAIGIKKSYCSNVNYVGSHGGTAVKLAFETRELRELCESQVTAERAFGLDVANRLRGLLADLEIAEHLQEIPTEELREGDQGGADEYEAHLPDGYVMFLRSDPSGRSGLGRVDRAHVRRLKILGIRKVEADRG